MQESTCNPSAVGGGGEQGMFQITVDKCGGAPNGDCKEVNFNMRTAMKYFSDTLASNGGDAFLSMGQYNGWQRGMTFASATAAQYSSCCRCQNNLDYLHQLTNGWMQGFNGNNFGTYFNLRTC
ncbi:glycoside hydrolase family 23 protein [Mrakia frigida]|uniref:glycoside hydrolase family 23 protein n=1 Tax=Mrakia frigida TaxID=29902 RepID=UPI003FCBFE4E